MRLKIAVLFTIIGLLLIGLLIKTSSNKEITKPRLVVKHINQWGNFSIKNLDMLYDILSEKYEVVQDQNAKKYDLLIDGVFGTDPIEKSNAIKIYYTAEAEEPNIDAYDLSIGFGYSDNPRYIRIPSHYMISVCGGKNTNTKNSRGICSPNKKPYFACYLVTNGRHKDYNAVILRDRLFYQLSLYKRVESAGSHLNNRGEILPKEQTKEFLSKCKFIIAYENQSFPGYITEKLFQAYDAGSIPIYYSDIEAAKDVNTKSIIFAPEFSSEDSLVDYIKKVDQDDKLYCDIYNENLIIDEKKNYEAVKDSLRKKINEVFNKKNKN